MMPEKQAIDAMQTLFDFCESFVECKGCMYCINPHAEYGDQECFFIKGILQRSGRIL